MTEAAKIDIIGDRRVPCVRFFSFIDEDFTGWSFKMQVRAVRDTVGTPFIDTTSGVGGGLVLAYAGSATVAAHVAAGRLESEIYEMVNPATGIPYVSSDVVTLSRFAILIAAVSMDDFPYPVPRGDDFEAQYDIIRTPPSGDPEILMTGRFVVRAGVTIP